MVHTSAISTWPSVDMAHGTYFSNHNRTRGLWGMKIVKEMAELVSLWSLINEVQLSQDTDTIR
jgi:hypothetical protein